MLSVSAESSPPNKSKKGFTRFPFRLCVFIFVTNPTSHVMNPDSVGDWGCTSGPNGFLNEQQLARFDSDVAKRPVMFNSAARCCEATSNNHYFPKQPCSRRRHLDVNIHVWPTLGAKERQKDGLHLSCHIIRVIVWVQYCSNLWVIIKKYIFFAENNLFIFLNMLNLPSDLVNFQMGQEEPSTLKVEHLGSNVLQRW